MPPSKIRVRRRLVDGLRSANRGGLCSNRIAGKRTYQAVPYDGAVESTEAFFERAAHLPAASPRTTAVFAAVRC